MTFEPGVQTNSRRPLLERFSLHGRGFGEIARAQKSDVGNLPCLLRLSGERRITCEVAPLACED